MSNPLLIKCPTCGEGAGKSCRDYGAIPYRVSKFDRMKTQMRSNAPYCQPHDARQAAADKMMIR